MSNPLFVKVPIQCFSEKHNHEKFSKEKDLGLKFVRLLHQNNCVFD